VTSVTEKHNTTNKPIISPLRLIKQANQNPRTPDNQQKINNTVSVIWVEWVGYARACQMENMIRDHMTQFHQRLGVDDGGDQKENIVRMLGAYRHLKTLEERKKWIFRWGSGDGDANEKITLHPLRRIQPEECGEFYYYGFLHTKKFLSMISGDNKRRRVSTPSPLSSSGETSPLPTTTPTKKKHHPKTTIMVYKWSTPIAHNTINATIFGDDYQHLATKHGLGKGFDVDPQSHPHHKKEVWLSPEKYKLSFLLKNVRLALHGMSGGSSLQLNGGHDGHHLITSSNCIVSVVGSFQSLTIYAPLTGEQVVLGLDPFKPILLSDLVGDTLCYIVSRSSLLLHYSIGGSVVLKTDGHCHLDLTPCFIEYWTSRPHYSPITYHIEESGFWYNLYNAGVYGIDTDRRVSGAKEPERCLGDRGSYDDGLNRYKILRDMHVKWEGDVPYFFYNGKPISLTRRDDVLIYEGRTLAHFKTMKEKNHLLFALIYNVDSKRVQLQDYRVY
jgi:hypothetical protein